mgnify:CR=1 FL=1
MVQSKMRWILLVLFFCLLIPTAAEAESAPTQFVFTKDFNIWLFDETNEAILPITTDGYETNPYSNPFLSFDHQHVAYEDSGNFYFTDLQNSESVYLEKLSSPDIFADTLVGWDIDNNVYFTLTYGGCEFTAESIVGPEKVMLYRYNADSGNVSEVQELPKMHDETHAYSLGDQVSPDGEIVSFYGAACYAGYGDSRFYMTLADGEVFADESNLTRPNPTLDRLNLQPAAGYHISEMAADPSGTNVAYVMNKQWDDFYSSCQGEDCTRMVVADLDDPVAEIQFDAPITGLFGWLTNPSRIYFIESEAGQMTATPSASLMVLDLDILQVTQLDQGIGLQFGNR